MSISIQVQTEGGFCISVFAYEMLSTALQNVFIVCLETHIVVYC